jgi:hypothetical protein
VHTGEGGGDDIELLRQIFKKLVNKNALKPKMVFTPLFCPANIDSPSPYPKDFGKI